eukprot:TRINITY_DN4250_c0_g1_i1.p1 TRINITY_DN4250_c0_g1~~TRINITY_DN4250_c0_g1_i1.p1  ORF type:complete len:251 (-),score=67.25 TRINITY_DN4250_c0_g1_i1:166-918(-)
MARNEEKSHSMLNRWLQLERNGGVPKVSQKRPHLVELCNDVPEAIKWRLQVVNEIGKNVLLIQNASLEEYKIRDINDEINKSIREKGHWERRIRELGGPDLSKAPITEEEDEENGAIRAPGGYYYFGAAKDLPGVRALLKPKRSVAQKRTRYDMYQRIDADYYGYRDDDDGLLETLEAEAEVAAQQEAIEEWNQIQIAKYGSLEACPYLPRKDAQAGELNKVHIDLPTREDIEQELLRKRKEDMVKRYLS